MKLVHSALSTCILVLSCNHEWDLPIPALVASSKYIEYRTWVYPDGLNDNSVVCMDDKLAEMDRFVESVAEVLDIDPPETIHYVWVPPGLENSKTWICAPNAAGCYEPDGPSGHGIIYSEYIDLLHELVHAVETPSLGRAHPVFEEGMANYLSTPWSSEDDLDDFVATFQAGIGPGNDPGGTVSMHFVGSLLARGSLNQYKELRRRVAYDDGLAALASAYKAVYGEDLDVALADMSKTSVRGRGVSSFCAGESTVPWPASTDLETTLAWECGDGSTFGLADNFGKEFSIDVSRPGSYRMTLSAIGSEDPPFGMLDACPDVMGIDGNAIIAVNGTSAPGRLPAGRYTLRISMPPGPGMTGEASLKMTYGGPL